MQTRTEEPAVELQVLQPDDADVVITDDFDHEVCSEPGFDSSSSDEDEENEDKDEEQPLSAEPVAKPHNLPGTSTANTKRSPKEVVSNDRVKAKAKTAGQLDTVKRRSSGNKDSYKEAQNELSTATTLSSGRQNPTAVQQQMVSLVTKLMQFWVLGRILISLAISLKIKDHVDG